MPTIKRPKLKEMSTQMATIEKMYGKDFGVPNDKNLWDSLEEMGYGSLSKILRNDKKKLF